MAAGTLIPINDPADTNGAPIVPVAADGTNGHRLANDDGQAVVVVQNPDEESLTITLRVPAEIDAEFVGGLSVADQAITTADALFVLPKMNPKFFKQRSGDNANYNHISISGTLTNVTLFAIRAS